MFDLIKKCCIVVAENEKGILFYESKNDPYCIAQFKNGESYSCGSPRNTVASRCQFLRLTEMIG